VVVTDSQEVLAGPHRSPQVGLEAREIAKFNRGEQTALVSFTNIARLARNASEELIGSGMRAHVQRLDACPRANLQGPAP
jgi:hypothetical protein